MFGKRKTPPSLGADQRSAHFVQQKVPDSDNVFRAIPKEFWDGPHGDMLREAGLYPDSPSNLTIDNKGLIDSRIDRALAAQKQYMDELNVNLNEVAPGVSVAPWSMVPWTVWHGQAAPFLLIVCNMYPPEKWNMFLMPANDASSYALSMPRHPFGEIKGIEENCTRLLLELYEKHQVVFNETSIALEKGDLSTLDAYGQSRIETQTMVVKLAHAITADVFGQEVYDRQKQLFSEQLGW